MEAEIIEKSRQFINEGKYEKAQIILRRALDETPNRAEVLELCGDLASKLGRLSEAVTRYEHAFENYTNNAQYSEAIICLEKILMIDELNESVLFRLVDLYHFYGLRNEAIKKLINVAAQTLEKKNETLFVSALRKIIEFQPKNLPLRLSFAKLLFAVNRTREAEDELIKLRGLASDINDETILNEIKKLLPQTDGGEELDPKSRIELGNLLYEIGSRDEAIIEFKKAADDLIREGKFDDAMSTLNRILEIDPNNAEALQRIKELKSGLKPEEKVEVTKPEEPVESGPVNLEITEEELKEEVSLQQPSEEAFTAIQSDLEILADLSKEIEGFKPTVEKEVPLTVEPTEEVHPPAEKIEKQTEEIKPAEIPPLEGQIADIEFLLKESEAVPTTPRNFEIAKQFDELRTNITWETEDINKKMKLAKLALDAGLYEIALSFLQEEKDKKELWPNSIEIIGQSLIKLGRYNEAIKVIGPLILRDEISEDRKIELRYLLASGYEGLGDFENALREIERIIAINPDYRDVKEIYTLLGGKVETAEPVVPVPAEKVQETKPVEVFEETLSPEPGKGFIEETPTKITEAFVEKPSEETMPVVEESYIDEKITTREEIPEEGRVEEKGENIAFL